MKMLLLLATLLTITACNGSGSGSEAEKFLNGVEEGESDHVTLTTSIETDIRVEGNKYEILSKNENVTREVLNGSEYECALETYAGMTFDYSINGNQLTLRMGGQQEVYTRKSGSGNKLDGVWTHFEKDGMGGTLSTLSFNQEKLKIELQCSF